MSFRLSAGNAGRAPGPDRREATLWPGLRRIANRRVVIVIAFLLGAAVMLFYDPFSHPEAGDPALYDYMAQCIVRGQIPYRDVVDGKAPGSLYVSAAAMVISKTVGLRDIIGVRLMNVLLVGLLSALTYAAVEAYLRDRIAAFIAFLIPLMSTPFALLMMGGTQPKLAMALFGILTLLLIAKDRPMWAGACSMLSCLCWQPGLMFTGVAFLMFSRYLTGWRDRRALKVMLGAAIPLAAVLVYFYSRGALGDLWSWTITYNYTTYGPKLMRGFAEAVSRVWETITDVFRRDVVLVILSAVGITLFFVERIRAKFERREALGSPELFKDALLIPPAVYLGFCLISFQGPDDLIPLFPFVGIFAGLVISKAARGVASSWRTRWAGRVLIVAPVFILVLAVVRAAAYRVQSGSTLQDQEKEFAIVADLLGTGDKIYAHRGSELLVLLDRSNLNKYVLFDRGKDDYVDARMPGGFKAVLDEMESQAPKIVSISHLGQVSRRDELRQWVETHYELVPLHSGYDHVYIRKRE